MLFTSWTFLVFFGIVLLLYYRLPMRGQNTLLLAGSYVFYGAWDWRFLGLLFFSTCVDYFVGLGMQHYSDPRQRKLLIVATCCSNLGILSLFKYFNFFVDSATRLMTALGLASGAWRPLHIILPVGISFYTFQSLSYTIDCYRGKMRPVRHFPDFALFVAYFPQLVAGPIERAVTLVPLCSVQSATFDTPIRRRDREKFAQAARQWGVPVIHAEIELSDDDFPDLWHLRKSRAAVFTRALAKAARSLTLARAAQKCTGTYRAATVTSCE